MILEKTKPFVCICDFVVVVKPLKHLHRLEHERASVRKDAVEKYVTKFSLENYPITLDENGNFPTERTKSRVLRSIWMYGRKKGAYEDVSLSLINVSIKSKSRVSYDFNYDND